MVSTSSLSGRSPADLDGLRAILKRLPVSPTGPSSMTRSATTSAFAFATTPTHARAARGDRRSHDPRGPNLSRSAPSTSRRGSWSFGRIPMLASFRAANNRPAADLGAPTSARGGRLGVPDRLRQDAVTMIHRPRGHSVNRRIEPPPATAAIDRTRARDRSRGGWANKRHRDASAYENRLNKVSHLVATSTPERAQGDRVPTTP